jgi:hypothetical protein
MGDHKKKLNVPPCVEGCCEPCLKAFVTTKVCEASCTVYTDIASEVMNEATKLFVAGSDAIALAFRDLSQGLEREAEKLNEQKRLAEEACVKSNCQSKNNSQP